MAGIQILTILGIFPLLLCEYPLLETSTECIYSGGEQAKYAGVRILPITISESRVLRLYYLNLYSSRSAGQLFTLNLLLYDFRHRFRAGVCPCCDSCGVLLREVAGAGNRHRCMWLWYRHIPDGTAVHSAY